MGLQSSIMSVLYFVHLSMQVHRSLFRSTTAKQRVIASMYIVRTQNTTREAIFLQQLLVTKLLSKIHPVIELHNVDLIKSKKASILNFYEMSRRFFCEHGEHIECYLQRSRIN